MTTIGVEEAAKLLRCSIATIQQKALAKEIPAMKFGKQWVFIPDDLISFIRSQYDNRNAKAISCSRKELKVAKFGRLTLVSRVDQELENLLA